MSKLTQQVIVTGAYDKRDPNPTKNYGIGACRIFFLIHGPAGAVQFVIGTNWYTQSALKHLQGFRRSAYDEEQPKGWDVGYHSLLPHYEGQSSMECQDLPGGRCYYDGSSLRADDWVKEFVEQGTDWLWPKLEQYYEEVFEEKD